MLMMAGKHCTKCGEYKHLIDYHWVRHANKKTYKNSQCKACHNGHVLKRRRIVWGGNCTDRTVKKCSKCGKVKRLSAFHADKYSKDGHRRNCKICQRKYKQAKKNAKPKPAPWAYDWEDRKRCLQCGQVFVIYRKFSNHRAVIRFCDSCKGVQAREGQAKKPPNRGGKRTTQRLKWFKGRNCVGDLLPELQEV